MRTGARKTLLLLLAVVVVGTLLYRSRDSIRLEGFSWSRLSDSVRHADLLLLLLSLFAIQICFGIRAWRWLRFSRYLGNATFANIYTSTVIGFSAIFLLGRAAEPIRPLLIARKDNVRVSNTFGVYVLERMFDMGSTVVLAALALLAVPRMAASGSANPLLTAARTTGIAMLAGLACGVGFLVYFRMYGADALQRRTARLRARGGSGWRTRVAGLLDGFSQGLQAIRDWTDLAVAVGLSAVHWLLIGFIYLWISRSFGGRLAQLDIYDALLVLAFTMVGSTVQLPGVGGGSQVASFLAYTVIFGVDKEPAAAAAIVIWLITFAGSAIVGVPLLIKEGWSMGELRRIAREESKAESAGSHVDIAPDARSEGEAPR